MKKEEKNVTQGQQTRCQARGETDLGWRNAGGDWRPAGGRERLHRPLVCLEGSAAESQLIPESHQQRARLRSLSLSLRPSVAPYGPLQPPALSPIF